MSNLPSPSSRGPLERFWRWLRKRAIRFWRWAFPSLARTETQILFERIVSLAKAAPSPPLVARIAFVVPVFNTPPAYLDALCAAMRRQRQGAWDLILSDDGSTDPATRRWLDRHARAADMTILRAPANRGIAVATNAGIDAARSDWVAFHDHDDALAPHAVDRILDALARAPDCMFLYTDEVVADANLKPEHLFLKPAFDTVLLSGVNYVNHLALYRRDRLVAVGGLREGFDGSQDYDLLLRYTRGLGRRECLHLPYPAYLWRRDGRSFSSVNMSGATQHARSALAEAYARDGVSPPIGPANDPDLHRIRFDQAATARRPLVSIVIPSRDSYDLIQPLLARLRDTTDYPAIEIFVIDNGSQDPRVLALYEECGRGPIPFAAIVEPGPFNFSQAVNKGVARAKGELILLLNNDIEILEPGWLAEMVSCFAYPDVGIVGAKLLYPDRTIQHAGVIVGFGGLAGHWYERQPENFPGALGRLRVRQSLSCVTGACLLTSRAVIERIGGFDEETFAIAYNDVDFCLRAVKAGFRVVWTPFATLLHHESVSRGSDERAETIERFRREQAALRARHHTDTYEDFAINPWLSKDRSTPQARLLKALPPARSAPYPAEADGDRAWI